MFFEMIWILLLGVVCVALAGACWRMSCSRDEWMVRAHELSDSLRMSDEHIAMLEDERDSLAAEVGTLSAKLSRKGTGRKGSKKAQ